MSNELDSLLDGIPLGDDSPDAGGDQVEVAPETSTTELLTKPAAEVDIEDIPRGKWPVIVIDEEKGKPNFEFVGVNGTGYRIQRGVETPIPPKVLHVLQNAVAERLEQSRDPVTGSTLNTYKKYSLIPYRIVRFTDGG